jgi:hypothetical protein
MDEKENDPDTLQLRDESNTEWVKQWRKTTKKKSAPQNDLAIGVIPSKKELQRNLKLKSKKMYRV